MKVLTVATRRGELALAQAHAVIVALKAKHPDIEVRIQEITTAGDKDRHTALWDLKDTGFFTSQLEDALLSGAADLAVHSFKDLPTQERAGLAVTAICNRRWPEDCLLARHPVSLIDDLPEAAQVGTSSLRRAAQLRHLRPDLQLVPLRGNVQTRVRKLQTAGLDAIVLARAGLERLGLATVISVVFDPRQFIPAPAQEALAVQTRSDDEETIEIVRAIDDALARALALAERQVLVAMKCGCHAPVGAYAERRGETMELHAFSVDVFFDAIHAFDKDARVFGSVRLATLGAKTTECLARYGIKADFVPTVFTGRDLGLQLMSYANLHDKKVLLLRSELASAELVDVLKQGGAQVHDVAIYTAVPQKGDAAGLEEQIQQGRIHWLTFASPSSVRGFFAQVRPEVVNRSETKVASIGPVTSKELAQFGIRLDVEATEHTTDGLLDAIEIAELSILS